MALLFPLILRRRNLGTTSNKSKKMSSPPFTTTRLGGYTLLTSEQVKEATKLNDIGHLFHYPSAPNADSFDVNIIVGLARADFSGKDIDMFMFAMQLYQIEMYTVEKLQNMK